VHCAYLHVNEYILLIVTVSVTDHIFTMRTLLTRPRRVAVLDGPKKKRLVSCIKNNACSLRRGYPALFYQQQALVNGLFALATFQGQGHQSVQRQLSGFTLELRDEDQAEANIAVAVARGVVVAISRPAVLGIVVPAPAAKNTVRTHD